MLGRRVLLVLVSVSLLLGFGSGQAVAQRVPPGGAPPPGSGPKDVPGFVRVIDGDSLELWIDGKRTAVGLSGVEAPQGNTECGREAASTLRTLLRGGIRLEEDTEQAFDDRKRRIYHAITKDGRSVGEEMVKAGLSRANRRGDARPKLEAAEATARSARRGCAVRQAYGLDDQVATFAAMSLGTGADVPTVLAVPESAPQQAVRAAPAATSLPSGFSQETIASGLNNPTAFVSLPDGRLLIAEKDGLVKVFKNGALLATPLIDIRDRVNDYWDRGLLGIAADPGFATNGYVYLLYTYENDAGQYFGTKTGRLARYTVTGDVASVASEAVILGNWVGTSCNGFPAGFDCIPSDSITHGVGNIKLASDGTMFLTVGDASAFNVVDDDALRAQNLDSLAGKVIHITTSGQGVPSNPYWNGDPSANRSKIWASGLRNPYRFNLQPGTNVPYLGDVGWNTWEEVNSAPAGANFGWPCYEGNFRQSGYEPKTVCQALYNQGASAVRMPLVAWDHTDGNGNAAGAAATGGVFYTGATYPGMFQGVFFYGDYAQSFVRYVRTDASHNLIPGSDTAFATGANGPVDIETGSDGNLYYVAIAAGELRRIRFNQGNTAPTASASATPSNGLAPLSVQFSSDGSQDPDGDPLTYDWDFGDSTPHSTQANPQHTYATNGTYAAAVAVSDGRGGTATATVTITVGNRAPTATISAPSLTFQFKVGDVINYAGSATDPEDSTIPAAGLKWQVILHHCPGGVCHAHPLISSTGPTGSFTAPDHGDESHFELKLTATDSAGLSSTTSMLIQPQTVQITLASNPDGLQVIYDGTAATAPKSHTTIIGSSHTIQVPATQGGRATFASWSDGGTIQHDVVAGATDSTYTASFTVTPAAPRSISLNGTSAYAVAPHHAELNTTGDWTAEAWLKDETSGGFNHPLTYLLGKSDTNSDGEAPYLVYVEWGSLFAGERTGWGNQVVSHSLAGVDANAWHHVAVTMKSATRQTTIYLDGAQVAQGVLPAHSTTGNSLPVSIGRNGTTGNFWRGKIDDVRIWNVVRTAAEIAGSFQDELVGTPAGLVGNWKIEEGTGTTAADSAGALQNALLQGATWSTDAHGAAPAPDTAPPVISAVQSGSLTSTGATITWTTDEAADSQVEYGTTTSYGASTTLDTNRVTAHLVGVSGLTPSTTYHYRVKSKDAAGNLATSGDLTVTTTAPAPPRTCPCSVWPTSATPGTATAGDTQAVEVGVKLRSDVDGYVTGIRFYKGSGNTGTHIGSLWSGTGTRLANATFSGETATGWQQVTFATPVQVTANTTYVASYHAPNGGYARDPDFFAANGVDSGSLHALASPVSGGNGVYKYGPAGSFPDQSYAATNYWVDVVFTTTPPAPDTTAPVISAVQATAIASNGATITWTTDEAADSQVEYGTTTSYGSQTTLDASMVTGHSVPVPGLTTSTTYHYRVKSKDASGNLTTSSDFTFTTNAASPPPTCPCTIWPDTATPAVASEMDPSAFELGVKFRADADGYVTGVRFYKGSGNTGTHVGSLWSATGSNLANATFTGETATGWQQVMFTTPVQVTANTTYVASYHAPNGRFSKNEGYFASTGTDRAPLHALAGPVSGGNGVFKFGASGFPNQSYNATNYWVDVVFTTTPPPPDATAPVVSAVQSGSLTSSGATITWTTDEAADSQVEYGTSASYGSSTTLDTSRVTAHSVAVSGLTANTLYHYRVKSKDAAGNPATSGDFTFTTAAPPPPPSCPCTIWPDTATPQIASDADTSAFELGVKFRSDVDGYVTGVRFYKGSGNTGTHVGSVWSGTGTRLANATFSGETATGWQQVSFATPVQVTANTTYVASYHAPNGGFAKNEGYFATGGFDRAPLHALASPASGGNGVYKFGASGFPAQTYNASNYWVDVVFTTTPLPDATAPVISAVQATSIASHGATITWTTDELADTQVEYGTSTSYGSSTAVNQSQVTAHSQPLSGLTPSTVYHYRVKSRDTAGNLATSGDQAFTTGGP